MNCLNELEEGTELHGFRLEALYVDDDDRTVGASLRHEHTGLKLELLGSETVPQAYVWVDTVPESDRGEPHTQEHLLLGKGDKGRQTALMEDMALVDSSAFTDQLRTVYHLGTPAGVDTFFEVLQARLDSLLRPDYTDEEIRREVHHLGVATDPDGTLSLEEKGTIYAEMVSAMQQPWSRLWHHATRDLYGEGHPIAWSSGGLPEAIRELKPEHIRAFHARCYQLRHMGMIAVLPPEISPDATLAQLDDILRRLQPEPAGEVEPVELPEPQPPGDREIVEIPFPERDPSATAPVLLSWPPSRDLPLRERILLELLLDGLAGAEDTNLYRALVDSTTRERQTGATSVGAWLGERQGHPVHVSIEGIPSPRLDHETLTWLRYRVARELEDLAAASPDDPRLIDLGTRLRNEWVSRRRHVRKWVGSPPRFGTRGVYTAWHEHLEGLAGEGFRRPLAEGPALAWVREQLERTDNPWAEWLPRWGLVGEVPLVHVGRPSAALLEATAVEREARLRHDLQALMASEATDDAQQALAALEARFDAATAELEAAEGRAAAAFLADPPMTQDDRLDYEVTTAGGVPLVASRFSTMSGAEVGLALTLQGVDEAHEDLIAVLPDLLTEVGVIVDGEPISHAAVLEAMRVEVLSVYTTMLSNAWKGRAELAVVGAGTDAGEARAALTWMGRFVGAPDWRPENLPRIRDVVDERLESLRRRMQGREEHWARAVGDAWVHQHDRLQLRTWCFLTKVLDVQRCRWRLLDPDPEADAVLADLQPEGVAALTGRPGALGAVASDLQRLLQDIPDEALELDWPRLVTRARADLATPPEHTLQALEALRRDVVLRAGARLWAAGGAVLDELDLASLVAGLGEGEVPVRERRRRPELRARLADRGADADAVHVGLLDANRQTGIVMLSIPLVRYEDLDDDKLLDLLAAKAYGGGGPHGLFMRTWAAGLAYSNGATASPASGTFHYYAERCPELPRTVGFVVETLKGPRPELDLTEYTLAQSIGSRAGGSYEGRAASMAADLVDEHGPDVVRAFRERLLALRQRPDLDAAIGERIGPVYARLLPGLGDPNDDLSSLVIGDDRQLDAWEAWLADVEGRPLVRIYGRDFWL